MCFADHDPGQPVMCQCCGKRPANQKHHRWPQRAWVRKLYAREIDDPRNIQFVCAACHVGHHAGSKLERWDEIRFCKELGIEPRSKGGQEQWQRMKSK